MPINPKTSGLSHIALRVNNFERTKAFYGNLMGFPLAFELPHIIGYQVGDVHIGFMLAQPADPTNRTFTPFNVGLDHLAIRCDDEAELRRVAAALQAAGVENTGIKTDTVEPKQYVAFKDPDRISWEFYMA